MQVYVCVRVYVYVCVCMRYILICTNIILFGTY